LIANNDADRRSVIGLSWEDAKAFCRWLGKRHQIEYDLPTEAQWEYACRAGSAGRWSFGDDTIGLAENAVCEQDRDSFPAAAGGRKPNAFGLYDMHGNADEWCLDWHKTDFYGRSPIDDPVCLETATDSASGRVVRGGSWSSAACWTRSASRSYDFPGLPVRLHGFRVAIVGELETEIIPSAEAAIKDASQEEIGKALEGSVGRVERGIEVQPDPEVQSGMDEGANSEAVMRNCD
jgi:formylglycine-generating enzyme required for sulfatase activity